MKIFYPHFVCFQYLLPINYYHIIITFKDLKKTHTKVHILFEKKNKDNNSFTHGTI